MKVSGLSFVKKGLIQAGFAVDHAADGDRGLDLAFEETYDVIIVDIMLPKRDGLSVIRQLRREKIQTPVLILSAKDPEAFLSCLERQKIEAEEMTGFLITGKDRIGSVANALDPLANAGINGIAGSAMVCDNKYGMLIVVSADQGDDAEKVLDQ